MLRSTALFERQRRRIGSRVPTRSTPGLTVLFSVTGLIALLSGCSAAARPDPGQAFDEIARRSLNEETQYVRAHLAPSYLAAAKAQHANVESDEFIRGLMTQLQLCRSTNVAKTGDPNTVTVEAACVLSGAMVQSKFDLVYEKKSGWMLAAPAYDTRPMHPAGQSP
jgi:hypothetical protein